MEWPRLCAYVVVSTIAIVLRIKTRWRWRITIDGYQLLFGVTGSSGFGYFSEVIAGHEYELFRPALAAGQGTGVLLDCGANAGFFSLWARRQNGRMKIYAFEPHPTTFTDLQTNIRINDEQGDIFPENQAVGDVNGMLEFQVWPDTNMAIVSALTETPRQAGAGLISVPVTTIDGFCANRGLRPTLLKVDVEGYEMEVLRGASHTLEDVSALVVEAHSPALIDSCTALLEKKGFVVVRANSLLLGTK